MDFAEMKQILEQYFLLLNGKNRYDSSFIPTTDDLYNLGHPSIRWKSLWLAMSAHMPGLEVTADVIMSGLPTDDPLVDGKLWNDLGIIRVSGVGGTIRADTISEFTPNAGVNADGVLLKDNIIPASAYPLALLTDGSRSCSGLQPFTGGIKTDTIVEVNPDAGVTVDDVLLKDGKVMTPNLMVREFDASYLTVRNRADTMYRGWKIGNLVHIGGPYHHTLPSARPVTPLAGDTHYDAPTDTLEIYDGEAWKPH